MRTTIGWAAALILAVPAAAQEKKPEGAAAVDQNKVDEAVRKGVEWLRGQSGPRHEGGAPNHSNELILYTFLHAGVPETDPKSKAILDAMLAEPLEKTYKVALQAMILEEVERVKHQVRIWQCAQFLLDNQCANGQWSYGTPTEFANVPPPAPKPVASGGGVKVFTPVGGPRVKPEVTRKLVVKRNRDGGASGDFSNSQYAALGLRACFESGIGFPKDALELAKRAWIEGMHPADPKDGGYGGRGWCYGIKGEHDGHDAYGSMTAGAVGSVCIFDHMLGADPKRDPVARAGIEWLGGHFTVEGNVGPPSEGWMNKDPKVMHYYFLYGLERAGILFDTVKMGKHDWYATGATYLLAQQKGEGFWEGGSDKVWDTCFAILFLKRATRPLVASQDKR